MPRAYQRARCRIRRPDVIRGRRAPTDRSPVPSRAVAPTRRRLYTPCVLGLVKQAVAQRGSRITGR
jgi:hypothetical protein